MCLMQQEKFSPLYHGEVPVFRMYAGPAQLFIRQIRYKIKKRFSVSCQNFKKMMRIVTHIIPRLGKGKITPIARSLLWTRLRSVSVPVISRRFF
jgi:hypothetical protein